MSASMGIPGILIAHDMRGDTAKGFKAKIIKNNEQYLNIKSIINNIEDNIDKYNIKLINYKNTIK